MASERRRDLHPDTAGVEGVAGLPGTDLPDGDPDLRDHAARRFRAEGTLRPWDTMDKTHTEHDAMSRRVVQAENMFPKKSEESALFLDTGFEAQPELSKTGLKRKLDPALLHTMNGEILPQNPEYVASTLLGKPDIARHVWRALPDFDGKPGPEDRKRTPLQHPAGPTTLYRSVYTDSRLVAGPEPPDLAGTPLSALRNTRPRPLRLFPTVGVIFPPFIPAPQSTCPVGLPQTGRIASQVLFF